ncbi:MAG: CHC2 zinc finger domain-containing protein [Nitrospirota bacterium]
MFTRRVLFKILAAVGGSSVLSTDGPAGLYRRFRFNQAFPAFPPAPGKTEPSPVGSISDLSIVEQWENLLDDLDGVELIGRYTPLIRSGDHSNSGKGPCPFCRHGPNSLLVDARDDSYFCTDCLAGGHALDFYGRMEGLSLSESVRQVRELLDVGQLQGKRPWLKALRRMMEATAELAHNSLVEDCEGQSALAWLERQGITEATIERFALGVMSSAVGRRLVDSLLAAGFDAQQLDDAGVTGWLDCKGDLVRNGETDRSILVPVRDRQGRCCGFYEQIVGETAELGNTSSCLPYGFRLLQPRRVERLVFSSPSVSTGFETFPSVVLVEHPWDVVSLAEGGMEQAVYVCPLDPAEYHDRLNGFLVRTRRAIWPVHQSQLNVEFLQHLFSLTDESIGRLAFMLLSEGERIPEVLRREGVAACEARLDAAVPVKELLKL